ncbi:MAG: oxidoreductase [Candidatus Helarchaeota archaeon]
MTITIQDYKKKPTFRRLLSPLKIRSLEMKNRIVMAPMHMNYCDSYGHNTPKFQEFYVTRARGGTALVIIGGAKFSTTGGNAPNMVNLETDDVIPEWKEFTDAIHKAGGKTGVQLLHCGRYGYFGETVAPSPVKSGMGMRQTPRELTIEEIEFIQDEYAAAAIRAKKAGFDAVEICGNTGYLPSQFISKFTNRRKDKYGGDLKQRCTFSVELIQKMRKAVGDFPIIYRLPPDDLIPDSTTNAEMVQIVPILAEAGADMFHVAGGFHEARVPQLTMNVPKGYSGRMAGNIRRAGKIPVILAHRVHDAILAENLIAAGQIDCVGWGRPLICDPEIGNKLKEGRLEDIRWCIGCNQGCFDMTFAGQPVTCLQNPLAGKELKYKIEKTSSPKKVMVIGGGPGGMEAALVLKQRGHNVTLYEKNDFLGGDLYLASVPIGREEFGQVIDYLIRQLIKHKVDIKMNTEVTPDLIQKENPDAVVVATGNVPFIPNIPGIDGPNVFLAKDVLLDKVDVGDKVVIIGGGAVGAEVALQIARSSAISAEIAMHLIQHKVLDIEEAINQYRFGKKVVMLEMLPKIGMNIGKTSRWTVLGDLRYHGIEQITNAKVKEIKKNSVIYELNGEDKELEFDTCIIATGVKPNKKLYDAIKDKVKEVRLIGDAKKPRKALEAIEEGLKAAFRIK